MKWYPSLYVGEGASKQKNKIIRKLKIGAGMIDVWVITEAANGEDQFDILSSAWLKQRAVRKKLPMIYGIAKGYEEAVDLVLFAFEHAHPGDLFIQKADASTIADLAKGVQQLFGDTGTRVIGTRHGEKLYETLMTKEERLKATDMGHYYRVAADGRDLNYDKYFVDGQVSTESDEAYTSHNTTRRDVDGTGKKILTTDYVREALAAKYRSEAWVRRM